MTPSFLSRAQPQRKSLELEAVRYCQNDQSIGLENADPFLSVQFNYKDLPSKPLFSPLHYTERNPQQLNNIHVGCLADTAFQNIINTIRIEFESSE